jgi:general secretion pathway protein F
MNFTFKAINRSGQIERGHVRAHSRDAAVEEIDRMRLTPVEVRIERDRLRAILSHPLRWRRSMSSIQLVSLTQSLASLLKAGLTLDRALNIIQVTSEDRSVQFICADLERRVRTGATFADALEEHSAIFPSYYIPMVRAGELGGTLAEGLERLGGFVERAAAVKARIVSSLIYPSVLVLMIGVTISLVLTVVLPRFRALFAESQTQLPLSTRAVMAVGDFVHDYGWWVALILAGACVAVYRAWRDPILGLRLSRRLLEARWTFGLLAKTQSSRFLRTLGTLGKGGVALPDAMGVAIGMLQNRALLVAARDMHVRFREGADLSTLLSRALVFPKAAIQLARVGEETGRLEEMLLEAADALDRDAERTLDRLLSVLVPSITVLMGAIVAALIASVLVGILSLNDLAY